MSKLNEIKVYYQNICKKFIYNSNYDELLNLISMSFSINKDQIHFNYLDEEGDKIGITNQLDFDQLIKLSEQMNTSTIKINIEKNKPDETISELTNSILILNSQMDDDVTMNNLNREDMIEFKNKIKFMISKDIEEKLNEVKHKLISSIESKFSNLLSHNMTSLPIKKNKSFSNLKDLKNINSKRSSKIDLMYYNSNYKCSKVQESQEIENETKSILLNNIHCRKCGTDIQLNQSYFTCIHCEDVYFCIDCHSVKNSSHILLHIKNNESNTDKKHLDSLNNYKKIIKIFWNKTKVLKDRDKYISNNLDVLSQLAFNNFTDKIVIEVNQDESVVNDYMNMKFNIVNFSKDEINSKFYLECIFDQSDIFGNKIYIDQIVKGFEDFEVDMMFYNFKNKPPGFYISKWKLVKLENKNDLENYLTFVFHIKSKTEDIYSIEILNNTGNKKSFENIRKDSGSLKLNDGDSLKNDKIKFSDMYSEIIKKHQEMKK